MHWKFTSYDVIVLAHREKGKYAQNPDWHFFFLKAFFPNTWACPEDLSLSSCEIEPFYFGVSEGSSLTLALPLAKQPCLHIEAIECEGVKKKRKRKNCCCYFWLTCLSGLLCLQENNEAAPKPLLGLITMQRLLRLCIIDILFPSS